MNREPDRRRDGVSTPILTGRKLLLLVVLLVPGVAAMAVGLKSGDPQRVWEVYLVNLLFWSGLSQAGIIFSAVMIMTGARWWSPIRGLADGMASFLPVSFLLFLLLFLFGNDLFPGARLSGEEAQRWLRWDTMIIRDMAAITVLYLLSFLYLYRSGRGRADNGVERGNSGTNKILAPILVVAYSIVYSLLAIDLVMSLSPAWYSTLFGGYFFIGNLYLGLAAIVVLVVFFETSPDRNESTHDAQFHDLGKLLFAFCMLTGYLFFSQYLVIWYGKIPEETAFILRRTEDSSWAILSWIVLSSVFAFPFLVLLSRSVKVRRKGMLAISLIILVGMWLERYLLIVPSVYDGELIPPGWTGLAITLGFFSMWVMSYLAYFRRFAGEQSLERK